MKYSDIEAAVKETNMYCTNADKYMSETPMWAMSKEKKDAFLKAVHDNGRTHIREYGPHLIEIYIEIDDPPKPSSFGCSQRIDPQWHRAIHFV